MIGIEEVVKAFELWRSNKSSTSTPIPESLWLMAKELMPYYKKSHIQSALKVSGNQFNKYCLEQRPCGSNFKRHLEGGSTKHSDGGFVIATKEEVNVNQASNSEVQLTIEGKERSLTLCIGVEMLPQILVHVGVLL